MSYWQSKFKIGNQSYSRFIAGPLDGITDSPFRKLVREFSKDNLQYTEMRHVACVAHDKGGAKALVFDQTERPLNYQVAANDITYIAKACEKILAAGVDAVDLNVGCPAKNVIRSGGGSSLMADPARLKLILLELRRCLPNINFTVKIRAGYKEKNAVDIAKLIQDCGADALAIHPRLQTEHFAGRPDYQIAAQVKQALSIPVIFSGDVVNFKMAKITYEATGVDAFLIGRGIWGKPWKLLELEKHAAQEEFSVSLETIMHFAIKHLDLMLEYYGDAGLYNFRKHLPFYLKGFNEALNLRKKLVVENSANAVKNNLIMILEQSRNLSGIKAI
jgi:tRNA-dihydrouridine synthase B